MQRTQIYFEETMLGQLKQRANRLGISVSAYIRETLQKELNEQEPENETRQDPFRILESS